MNEQLKELEEKISYHFQDKHLLAQALTHSSYANEHRLDHNHCNERLEFLGDAVLEIVTSDFLYHKYTEKPEGDLTKIRASIVCEPTLAYCAEAINLGSYLFLGKGEDATGGRNRNSVVSDAMEAVIGAIYLDGGFASAKEYIHRFILNDIRCAHRGAQKAGGYRTGQACGAASALPLRNLVGHRHRFHREGIGLLDVHVIVARYGCE